MIATTSPTTRATAPAAINARMRCRRRRTADFDSALLEVRRFVLDLFGLALFDPALFGLGLLRVICSGS